MYVHASSDSPILLLLLYVFTGYDKYASPTPVASAFSSRASDKCYKPCPTG